MGEIIAGAYELEREIGSGGGGVVYLGRHLRLGKWVVLKADKRRLSTNPEMLRQEVDALKNLSHTYIPQVYDFVEENGTVYTVMDYIEGESLDKPLKRGERFSQPQVIEWACELLEAVSYLHSRPPHGILHADIKPANVMCTPEGDIRLIDFNIALALGEEGAVRVGLSRGYASPEHYGLDYTKPRRTDAQPLTELMTGTVPQTAQDSGMARSASTSGKKTVLLDVRSDIYSLGATLYHLLTGERPAQDAKEVVPISPEKASSAVAAIIQKAMAPDPDQRYQTAAEMLSAFEHLYENDPRTKRHKRRAAVTAAALAALFLAGGVMTFTGLKQMEQAQAEAAQAARLAEETERRTKQALAAVRSSEEAYRNGNIPAARDSALEALELDSPYAAQAQKALTDALGVYDLSDGFKLHLMLELPSEPLKVVLSPEGTRLAAVYAFQVVIFDTETGEKLVEFPMERSALSDVVFLDEDRIVYAGPGAVRAFDVTRSTELWSGQAGTKIVRSADGNRVAAAYKNAKEAVVYDASTGEAVKTVSFGERSQRVTVNDSFADPKDNLLALNAGGTMLAVSFADGSLTVFDLEREDGALEILDPCAYSHFEGGFFGKYFAFSGLGGGESLFAVIDTADLVQTGAFTAQDLFLVQADENGIYLALNDTLIKLDPETGEQTEIAYTSKDITGFRHGEAYTLVATEDQSYAFFDRGAAQVERTEMDCSCDFVQLAGGFAVVGSRDTPELRIMQLEEHPEAELFSYDPAYSHDEARLSADGKTVMLFRYDAFRLYGIDGQLLAEVELPDAEQIYDQQYRRDERGSYLEVIYNDGLVRSYSAADGALLSETEGETPDLSLYEEFYTDWLKITAPLHETPAAYDRESGALIRELEKDAYLTYVTQAGEYVITEYISAQGERYGLLLDENCETLARLPNLCDIVDGTLVFDYPSGNLRFSRIYSTQELRALGKNEGRV